VGARHEAELNTLIVLGVAVRTHTVELIHQHCLQSEQSTEVEIGTLEYTAADVVESLIGQQRSIVAAQTFRPIGVQEQPQPRFTADNVFFVA
jgi:hypothetical protein